MRLLCSGLQEKNEYLKKLVDYASLKSLAGPIRDQMNHIICWAYVAGDLVSVQRIIRGWEDEFVPLCPRYLVDNVEPHLRVEDEENEGHVCYGGNIGRALRYIKAEGIPKENLAHKDFDCHVHRPPCTSEEKNKDQIIQDIR